MQGWDPIWTKRINYNVDMYNFNHYNKQTLLLPLLFHQHYIIFMYIILTKTCKFLHY